MGFLEKFIKKPSPEAQRQIDERNAQIRSEGDEIIADIHRAKDTTLAANREAAARRMSGIDEEIAGHQAARREMGERAAIVHPLNTLHRQLLVPLMTAVGNATDSHNLRGDMESLRQELHQRVGAIENNLSISTVAEAKEWALSKAGNDEKLKAKIATAFDDFLEDLGKKRIAIE